MHITNQKWPPMVDYTRWNCLTGVFGWAVPQVSGVNSVLHLSVAAVPRIAAAFPLRRAMERR